MTRWRAALAAALLALAGCAADPAHHDFSGGFAGVTMAPAASTTTLQP